MGQNYVHHNRKILVQCLALAAMATLILTGCSGPLLSGGKPEPNSVIWSHRDQFVHIESQDRGKTAPLPNDHPAVFSPEQLFNMLGALEVKFEDQEEPVSLFTIKELEILAPAISTGLAKVGPREDITFAIVGIHRGLISFSHDRAIITGRIFVSEGKLNLIVGKLHEEYLEEDRRIKPLHTGSRKESLPLPMWGEPWKVIPMEGLETRTVAGVYRHDWLVLNPDMEIWKAAIAVKKEAKETAKAAFKEASEVRETSAQLEAEQQQLRTEIQEMKQAIEAMKQAPATTAPPAAAAPSAPAAPTPGLNGIEGRLELLQKLKSKGLITDEEFRTKKQEILDTL